MKDNKSLILYNQPHKGLRVPSKRDVLIIGLSVDESDKREYLKQRIIEQDKTIIKLKDALNSLSGKRDELKYLREYRDMSTLSCILLNISKLTIFQCTENIKRGRCKERAYSICKPRKEYLKRIEV